MTVTQGGLKENDLKPVSLDPTRHLARSLMDLCNKFSNDPANRTIKSALHIGMLKIFHFKCNPLLMLLMKN